jgi:hypothetical protein
MSELAQFFRPRFLLVLVLFDCVWCFASANHRVTTPLSPGFSSSSRSFSLPPWPGESVRTELAQLQEQTGLSLVWVASGAVQVVLFSHRSMVEANRVPVKAKWLPDGAGPGAMSPDGTEVAFAVRREQPGPAHLGISRTDGTDFREYPNLQYQNLWDNVCWSYDKSMLAMTVRNMESVLNRYPGLQIVNVSSGDTQEMVSQGSVTSQCWSPGGRQLVYEVGESVQVYDVEANRSRVIAQGMRPTWSPDGNWIAFLDHDTYYEISPSGTERHALFRKWHSQSGLWWSPDSRFVAYVSQAGLLEGGLSALDVETYWLRVRRLKDNSETRVAGVGGGENCGWVTNAELFRAAKSNVGQPPSLTPEFAGRVFLVGAVVKQGWYPLEGGGTILQVLAAAGGLAPYAKADSIYIERNEGKKHLRIPFHYKKAQQGGEKDIPLKPGDVVIVR